MARGSRKRRRVFGARTRGPIRKRQRRAFIGPRRFMGPRRNVRTGGFLGIELKFYDASLINDSLSAPADATGGEHDPSATVLMNTVTQGNGEEQRDGRQIVMKKISIKGVVTVPVQTNQTATDESATVFIALVLDTQTNGATINSEDVYTNKGANAATAASIFRNLQNVKRFQILKTVNLHLPHVEGVWDGTNIEFSGYKKPWQMHVNLGNISVNYTASTETVANISDNSLHLIAFANTTGLNPSISYNSRLRFVG